MSDSPELSLQQAVFAHLQQDTNVQNLLGQPVRLYDDPPPSPEFPFVSFGRHQSRELDGDVSPLIEHTFSLHVWSRYGGKAEGFRVLEALKASIGTVPQISNGHLIIGVRPIFSDVLRARDGRVFQVILRLRALSQSTL